MFIEMLNQQFLNLLVLAGFDSVEDLYVFFDIVLSIEGRLLIVVPRQEKKSRVYCSSKALDSFSLPMTSTKHRSKSESCMNGGGNVFIQALLLFLQCLLQHDAQLAGAVLNYAKLVGAGDEHEEYLIHLIVETLCHLDDLHPRVKRRSHQTLHFQQGKRLSHRSIADPQLFAEGQDSDLISPIIFLRKYFLLDNFIDLHSHTDFVQL